ncbi:hypothetical protein LSTR_LSTR010330 [Laodelphax striatellus]|uniref:Rad60/SUMO-like domain-containing protein n=1 Tax=Laodelphax striatellus TaxID=195883 RepID=A0A482X104_LAOST|nr:hypothetical protein LSTR_LSTR010330 [Laodelphax striatellus]
MFKDDSDSDEEGILSRAHANIAEKGIDPNSSFASGTGNDSVSQDLTLTQESTSAILEISDLGCYPVEISGSISEPVNPELNTSHLRRSPRIKRVTSNTSNSNNFITTRRGRARKVLNAESSNATDTTQKRNTRSKRGRKRSDVICIGSDDEEQYDSHAIPSKSKVKAKARSKNTKNNVESILLIEDDEASNDDYLDEIINVKIEWMCEGGLIIPHGRTQPFAKIYEDLSKMKGYDVNKIVLCKQDGKVVKPHDTPLSIKLSIIDILEGSVSSKAIENGDRNSENADAEADENNKNLCNFKILVEGQKAPSYVKMEKDQTMHVLLSKLAGQLNLNIEKMRLWFDGDLITPNHTPLTMELEGDECFEIKFKKP